MIIQSTIVSVEFNSMARVSVGHRSCLLSAPLVCFVCLRAWVHLCVILVSFLDTYVIRVFAPS